LEGLEISIQKYKTLKDISDYRIEAEYFSKRFLKIDNTFEKQKYVSFFEVANYKNGFSYFSDEFFENNDTVGVKIARIGDITQKRTNESWIAVSEMEFKNKRASYLTDNDILMTLTGDPPDVGKVNLFIENNIKSSWNQRVACISLKKSQTAFYSQKAFYIILSSDYCRQQLERYAKGIRQRNLGNESIEKLKIPILNSNVQLEIDKLVADSYIKLSESMRLYKQAEGLLLETLRFKNFNPSLENKNIKTFRQSFLSTGRIDAEYYQPKYDAYVNIITNYLKGFVILEKICNLKYSKTNLIDNKEYKYIELSYVGKYGEINSFTQAICNDLPSRAQRLVKTGDVIISSIEGSLNSCAVIAEEHNDAICSTGFYIIESDKINSETLLVLFKSELMQNILKQNCSGTILTAINKTEFQNTPIPLIDIKIQEQISELIQKSFVLRKESKGLLENAKTAVEREIERK
jgi:restriction endonuclease S subunit